MTILFSHHIYRDLGQPKINLPPHNPPKEKTKELFNPIIKLLFNDFDTVIN